jgi:hypothetical protein
MRRPSTISAPRLLRKPVSVAAAPTVAIRPVLTRVRDSLVLRLVKKRRPAGRNQPDAPRAR